MAVEFFHIRENDYEMIDQLLELEEELHPNSEEGISLFEINAFVKYGRVYVAVDYDEIMGCVYFMRDFENTGKVFLYAINSKPGENTRGIVITLLLSAFEDLKEASVRMIEVLVDPANFDAIQIYREKLNFNIINSVDEDENEDELLVLRKML